MGGEIAQRREWTHDQGLEWELVDLPLHSGMQRWVADLNQFYRAHAALHEVDFDPAGFEWIDCNDSEASVVSLLRKGRGENDIVLIVCNFTPVVRHNYLIGTPRGGVWNERLNSDAKIYGGSGVGNLGEVEAAPVSCHGRRYSLALTLPPLSVLFLGQGSEQ
jgi:1,4-alpha-glucan branching enzyme